MWKAPILKFCKLATKTKLLLQLLMPLKSGWSAWKLNRKWNTKTFTTSSTRKMLELYLVRQWKWCLLVCPGKFLAKVDHWSKVQIA